MVEFKQQLKAVKGQMELSQKQLQEKEQRKRERAERKEDRRYQKRIARQVDYLCNLSGTRKSTVDRNEMEMVVTRTGRNEHFRKKVKRLVDVQTVSKRIGRKKIREKIIVQANTVPEGDWDPKSEQFSKLVTAKVEPVKLARVKVTQEADWWIYMMPYDRHWCSQAQQMMYDCPFKNQKVDEDGRGCKCGHFFLHQPSEDEAYRWCISGKEAMVRVRESWDNMTPYERGEYTRPYKKGGPRELDKTLFTELSKAELAAELEDLTGAVAGNVKRVVVKVPTIVGAGRIEPGKWVRPRTKVVLEKDKVHQVSLRKITKAKLIAQLQLGYDPVFETVVNGIVVPKASLRLEEANG